MDIISILLTNIDGWKLLAIIADIFGILGVTGVLGYLITYYSWRRNQMSKLGEIADKEKIKLIKSKKYIPTMGQYEPPHDDENAFISSNRFSLLDKMLKDLGTSDYSSKKRYIIMGGSGMGKSTFLAALFYNYINKRILRKSLFPIYVKSLSNPKVIDQIREIKDDNVYRSILLLDALDENIHASNDIIKFMNELEAETHEFSTVIITCRTQFYKDAESEPHVWSIPVSGASKDRVIKYNSIYISPFTNQEVDTFLNERYGSSVEKYAKARIIANQSTDVMLRPMILSFMDDLLDLKDIDSIKTVEIYSKIIDKWFERECEIKNIEKSKLLSFSKKLAVFMYDQWFVSKDLFLTYGQYQNFIRTNGLDVDPYSYKERSLINRTSKGEIKFSHKSFWEFFLAIDTFERLGKRYTAKGLDMAQKFHNEIYELYNDGVCLDCIDYFDFRFSLDKDFSDSDIKNKLDSIQKVFKVSLNPDTTAKDNPEQVVHMIYELREMLIQRLRYQLTLTTSYYAPHDLNLNFDGISTKVDCERIFSILDIIQDFFEDTNLNHFKNHSLPTILRINDEISHLNEVCQDEFRRVNSLTNEKLLYPCLSHNIPETPGYIESIHIGLAFSQNYEIMTLIKQLLDMKPRPLIFLYVEGQTLNEITDFIILNSIKLFERRIIIRTVFNNTKIEYIDNKECIELFTRGGDEKITYRHDNEYKQKVAKIIGITIQNLIKAKNYK